MPVNRDIYAEISTTENKLAPPDSTVGRKEAIIAIKNGIQKKLNTKTLTMAEQAEELKKYLEEVKQSRTFTEADYENLTKYFDLAMAIHQHQAADLLTKQHIDGKASYEVVAEAGETRQAYDGTQKLKPGESVSFYKKKRWFSLDKEKDLLVTLTCSKQDPKTGTVRIQASSSLYLLKSAKERAEVINSFKEIVRNQIGSEPSGTIFYLDQGRGDDMLKIIGDLLGQNGEPALPCKIAKIQMDDWRDQTHEGMSDSKYMKKIQELNVKIEAHNKMIDGALAAHAPDIATFRNTL